MSFEILFDVVHIIGSSGVHSDEYRIGYEASDKKKTLLGIQSYAAQSLAHFHL